ncbi:hypothetical protein Ndes2526B_g06913 [Nannochloris sp. 'desiccata']
MKSIVRFILFAVLALVFAVSAQAGGYHKDPPSKNHPSKHPPPKKYKCCAKWKTVRTHCAGKSGSSKGAAGSNTKEQPYHKNPGKGNPRNCKKTKKICVKHKWCYKKSGRKLSGLEDLVDIDA